MLKALQIALLIATAVGAFFVIWSSSSFQNCVTDQETTYPQKTEKEVPPFVFARSNIGAISLRCGGHVAYQYRDVLTAVATLFIAFFTLTLWLSTKAMMKVTKEAVDLARKEFNVTHRPRIILRFFQGPFHDEEGHEFIWITFANIGDTVATIYAIGGDLCRRTSNGQWRAPGLDAEPREITPITLVSGQRHVHTVTRKAPVSDIDIFGDVTNTSELCAVGSIRYRDGNGITRETGFLRVYREGEGFIPSQKSEDEYQD